MNQQVEPSAPEAAYTSFTPSPFLESIPINRETPITTDIDRIIHAANEAKILVYLNKSRTCREPQFIGRLSGLFLSKIQWSYNDVATHNVIVGSYVLPSPGTYFVEIIMAMCQKLDMDTDATNICMINPSQHRLTHENATLDATFVTTINAEGIGFWYNKNHGTMNTVSVEPLLTRYQPQYCRDDNATLNRCKVHTDVTRFDPYEFRFNTQFSFDEFFKDRQGRLCFIGASHSRVLARFANPMSNIHVLHLDYRFVANLTQSAVGHVSKCGRVIIGMGQWDAGRHGLGPTSFRQFKKEMNRAMLDFVEPLLAANVSVYFRNMQ